MALYNALIDQSTKILLVVSARTSALTYVHKCTPDTVYAPSVNYPNYIKTSLFRRQPFFLADLSPEDYPLWTWDREQRVFAETQQDLLTDVIRAKSKLAVSKFIAITRMLTSLNRARDKLRTGLQFQESIYLTKKTQAQAFKDSRYDENVIMEYPYVLQYADFANISLKEAADDILFKAKLDDQYLANTELLRLRYFNKVRDATEPEQLSAILEEFQRDSYVNARVS